MKFHITVRFDHPYAKVAQRTMPPLIAYCARHGYRLTILQDPPVFRGIINDRLADVEVGLFLDDWWKVHFDADILITNPEITLESIVAQAGGASVIVGSGIYTGNGKIMINDGILMVRQDAAGNNVTFDMDMSGPGILCPMDALQQLYDSGAHTNKIFVAPPNLMNSYLMSEYGLPETTEGSWKPGDFVLHLPGRTNDRRCEILDSMIR